MGIQKITESKEPELQIAEDTSEDENEPEIISSNAVEVGHHEMFALVGDQAKTQNQLVEIDYDALLEKSSPNVLEIDLWRPSPVPMPGSEIMQSKLKLPGFCCFLTRLQLIFDLRYIELEKMALKYIEDQRKKKGNYNYDMNVYLKEIVLTEYENGCPLCKSWKGNYSQKRFEALFDSRKETEDEIIDLC